MVTEMACLAESDSDPSINSLSDEDTSDDMEAFDSAYDSTLVDKVVDTDFDPVTPVHDKAVLR